MTERDRRVESPPRRSGGAGRVCTCRTAGQAVEARSGSYGDDSGGVTRTVTAGGTGRRWSAWTALAVARLDRHWMAGLADRDRERLQARGPSHGRLVFSADERDLEERQAAGHADGTPGVVLDDDAP